MNNFKTIKKFKNLENHWINGKPVFLKTNEITNRIPVKFTSKTNNNNFLFDSNQFLDKKNFYKKEYIKYDINLNKLVFKKNIKFFLSNDNYNLDIILWKQYLSKNNKLKKIFKILKSIFQRLESQNFEKKLFLKKAIFSNEIINKKINNFKYGKLLPRVLLKNFLIKCTLIYIKDAYNKDKKIIVNIKDINYGGIVFNILDLPISLFMPFSLSNSGIKKNKDFSKQLELIKKNNDFSILKTKVHSLGNKNKKRRGKENSIILKF